MTAHTTSTIAAELGRSRRWIQSICRELFGPSNGTRRRTFTDEERARILKKFQQPGRWQSSSQFIKFFVVWGIPVPSNDKIKSIKAVFPRAGNTGNMAKNLSGGSSNG